MHCNILNITNKEIKPLSAFALRNPYPKTNPVGLKTGKESCLSTWVEFQQHASERLLPPVATSNPVVQNNDEPVSSSILLGDISLLPGHLCAVEVD